jgi:hypothetical protein
MYVHGWMDVRATSEEVLILEAQGNLVRLRQDLLLTDE